MRLGYDRRPFVLNMALLSISALVLASFVLVVMPADPAWMAILFAVLGLAVIVIGASPLLTHHELTDDALVLRQGWYFRLRIPLDRIASIYPVERGPRKVGVSFQVIGSRLSVTTRRNDLVEIELVGGIRAIWAWGKSVDRVVFDTLDNADAIRRIEDRSLSPIGTDRPV